MIFRIYCNPRDAVLCSAHCAAWVAYLRPQTSSVCIKFQVSPVLRLVRVYGQSPYSACHSLCASRIRKVPYRLRASRGFNCTHRLIKYLNCIEGSSLEC